MPETVVCTMGRLTREDKDQMRDVRIILCILYLRVCEVINMRVVTHLQSRRKCSAYRTREREREREGERDREHVPAPVDECSQGRAFSLVAFCWVQTTIA